MDAAHGRPASRRRVFWTAFALFGALSVLWSLASPLAAGPDENAHVVKAAAVVRGDLTGTSTPENPGAGTVTIPAVFATLMTYPICFAFQPAEAADCTQPLPAGEQADDATPASTWVIRNNPVYYALVGWPTLLPFGSADVYLVRVAHALLTSALAAWALSLLRDVPRRAPAVLGVLSATTPMVVFLGSIVNPSAVEITGTLALWVALLVLLRHPDPALLPRRAVGIAVVTALVVTSRGTALLWVAVVLGTALVAAPWANVRSTFLDRRLWPWLGVAVASVVGTLVWTLSAGTLEGGGAGHPELGFLSVAWRTLRETGEYLAVAVGTFGWLDTPLPTELLMLAAAVIGVVLALGLVLASRRDLLLLGWVVGVTVALPVLVHAWQAHNVGYIWTARYSMPLMVGIPVVAGLVAARGWTAPPALDRRLLLVMASGIGLLQLAAYAVNLHRYVAGAGGSWNLLAEGQWQPPVSSTLLLLGATAVVATGVVATVRWGGGPVRHG